MQDSKNRHLRTIAQLSHISTIGKKTLVQQQYLLHMSSQYGEPRPVTAEICWRVWGTSTNFNGFRVLALLMQPRLSPEANQTLHDVWPSPELIHHKSLGGFCPLTEFCQVKTSLCVKVLRSPIGNNTARHSTSGRQPNFVVQGM